MSVTTAITNNPGVSITPMIKSGGPVRRNLEVLSRQNLGAVSGARVSDLEAGDVLFGRGHQAISKVVSMLNGYWSHSAIYVGGPDRLVVSSTIPGIVFESVESFLSHYPTGGAGFARPQLPVSARREAAEWAIAKAVPLSTVPGYGGDGREIANPSVDEATPYNARDLGLAAALLLRALWSEVHAGRVGPTSAAGPEAATNEPVEPSVPSNSTAESLGPQTWTCAGFVYDAYWEGAGVRLTPSFLGTVEVRNNSCAVAGRARRRERRRLPTRDHMIERFERGRRMYRVVSGAVPELRKALSADLEVDVTAALGPNDLWHSGDLQTRWVLPKAPGATARRRGRRGA